MGFRGHIQSTKFAVDWERSYFTLVISSLDKRSLLSLILNTGNIRPRCAVPINFGSQIAGESWGHP